MSNVIQLLERLGQSPVDNHSIETFLDQATTSPSVSLAIAKALKSGNQSDLVALLGARTNVFCAVFPAKENDGEDEKKDDDDEKDSPDDAGEKSLDRSTRQVAIAS